MNERFRRYVALVRAINIGGKSVMKNRQLQEIFESVGCSEVASYGQSGNLVFQSERADPDQLARELADKIENETGYATSVFVLGADQLAQTAAGNPLEPGLPDDWVCQLMFLDSAPDRQRQQALMRLQRDDYQFCVKGKILYYAYPRHAAHRRRTIDFERVLATTGTTRTAAIIDKLVELAQ